MNKKVNDSDYDGVACDDVNDGDDDSDDDNGEDGDDGGGSIRCIWGYSSYKVADHDSNKHT